MKLNKAFSKITHNKTVSEEKKSTGTQNVFPLVIIFCSIHWGVMS